MIDFLLTPSGDLSFEENNNNNNRLKLTFYKSNSSSLKITFETNNYTNNIPSEKSLVISFDILEIKNNKKAILIKDNAYKMQQILMRLKTNLGELVERRDIGSELETIMHKNINDIAVQKKLESIILSSIKEIVPNCSVKAIPIIKKDNDYKQVMEVIIYENKEILMNYEMEV